MCVQYIGGFMMHVGDIMSTLGDIHLLTLDNVVVSRITG